MTSFAQRSFYFCLLVLPVSCSQNWISWTCQSNIGFPESQFCSNQESHIHPWPYSIQLNPYFGSNASGPISLAILSFQKLPNKQIIPLIFGHQLGLSTFEPLLVSTIAQIFLGFSCASGASNFSRS